MSRIYNNNGSSYKSTKFVTGNMPNQKPKRFRGIKAPTDYGDVDVYIRINFVGIFSALFILPCAPFDLSWKIGLAALYVLSSIHIEMKEVDEKDN